MFAQVSIMYIILVKEKKIVPFRQLREWKVKSMGKDWSLKYKKKKEKNKKKKEKEIKMEESKQTKVERK